MLNSLLKFTNATPKTSCVFDDQSSFFNIRLFRFIFIVNFFVMVSQIIEFVFRKKYGSIFWLFGWHIINFEVRTD